MAIKRIVTAVMAAAALSACKTVSMPKLDFVKAPEFHEDAANIDTSYPKVKDAPEAPTDVRSATQWDRDARAMQALRNAARPTYDDRYVSPASDEAKFEELKAKAQAYKKDDPITGPVQGFPDYKPRR